MAPIKFEENIKDKLEKRTMEPSVNAWQHLEQQLNADAKKQNNSKYWWFGIAAGFIGLLFVVQQFRNVGATRNMVSPVVVESEKETKIESITNPININESEKKLKETIIKKSTIQKQNSIATTNSKAESRKEKEQAPFVIAQKEVKEAPKVLNNVKISKDEVVASVVTIEKASENEEVQIAVLKTSESEIDALLLAAKNSIQLNDNTNIKTVRVDANALLENVETEMPPSLRGQIFKVIEKNLKTATTAVATRNE